ncbi:enoyl-CoA hydratase/isomerase family protein [uncultured Pseudoteredinibacter sp.]|uniref:enoyl-CoA hydratase/isomerase family protein n=1 Tax=uncultured Pseudoteredinibacter sp. TaxID=1641701 RepID=UPI0026393A63|nr:enoyl-CoA hydratase/isomerase family protein [uncultured Pseudoteredinibacter sp.]
MSNNYKQAHYQFLSLNDKDKTLQVKLNRPDKLNAINLDMLEELWTVFSALSYDDDIRVVIICGEGKAFCAGLDLEGPLSEGATLNNKERIKIQKRLSRLLKLLYELPQATIAIAKGAACGFGLGLMCACDLRYGSESLKANAAFIRLGFTGCDMGVSYFLPRIIGSTAANEMMLTGRFYDAKKLMDKGFLADIVSEENLIETALAAANDMLRNSPMGLRLTKEGIRVNSNAQSLEAALALEDRQQILSGYSSDQMTALMAFLSKSEPEFKDD